MKIFNEKKAQQFWSKKNITNIEEDELLTFFWINELYDENDPDTFMENV